MFDWDPDKAIANYEKHGISFEEGATVFLDVDGLDIDDPKHSTTEIRKIRVGASSEKRILVVVYTLRRTEDEKEKIRIISARPASSEERKKYSGQ